MVVNAYVTILAVHWRSLSRLLFVIAGMMKLEASL
jgi:hypothetical protein